MNENLTTQIVNALIQDGTCKLPQQQIAEVVGAAVAALTQEYLFMGVATPNLNPGAIAVPTIFAAVAVGAYRGFSNQSVDVGDIALFTSDDGGAWAMILAYSENEHSGDSRYVLKTDVVTSVSEESTDAQVPSAKCVYTVLGNIEALLAAI